MDFKAKNQKHYRSNSYERATVFYQRIENSERTSQSRGFPVEPG